MPTTPTPTPERAEGAHWPSANVFLPAIDSVAWAQIHGRARRVRVLRIARTRCWVAWTTSARYSRLSQIHVGELAAEAAPGVPVSHVPPPSLSHGLAALDCELSRRRNRAARAAQRRAERAALVAS